MPPILQNVSVKLLLELFKGKEKPKIVHCLENGPMRFSQLQKKLDPISKKVLSTQLRKLEEVGLIQRQVFPETPVRVEYSVTPLLIQARQLFNAVKTWEDFYRQNYQDRIKNKDLITARHAFGLMIEIFGDKWTSDIIFALSEGSKRFGQIKRELAPITQRVLTEHLRDLEHYGFVDRTVYDQKPLHVEYGLTDLCETLNDIGHELIKYTEVYMQWREKNPLE